MEYSDATSKNGEDGAKKIHKFDKPDDSSLDVFCTSTKITTIHKMKWINVY